MIQHDSKVTHLLQKTVLFHTRKQFVTIVIDGSPTMLLWETFPTLDEIAVNVHIYLIAKLKVVISCLHHLHGIFGFVISYPSDLQRMLRFIIG